MKPRMRVRVGLRDFTKRLMLAAFALVVLLFLNAELEAHDEQVLQEQRP